MSMQRMSSMAPVTRPGVPRALLRFAATLACVGCSSLTDVSARDVVQRTNLNTALGAVTLHNGAITQMYSAFGANGTANFVSLTGLMSDELTAAADILGSEIDALSIPEGLVF